MAPENRRRWRRARAWLECRAGVNGLEQRDRDQFASILTIAAATAVLTLTAGLTIEDIVPPIGWSGWREAGWITAVIVFVLRLAIVVGLGYFILRTAGNEFRRTRVEGTLYYLRMLPAGASDRLVTMRDEAVKLSLDFRSATGNFEVSPSDMVIDVRFQVRDITREFERSVNDDNEESVFRIAPNLVMPAALAVGYEWAPRANTVLKELQDAGNAGRKFDFDMRASLEVGATQTENYRFGPVGNIVIDRDGAAHSRYSAVALDRVEVEGEVQWTRPLLHDFLVPVPTDTSTRGYPKVEGGPALAQHPVKTVFLSLKLSDRIWRTDERNTEPALENIDYNGDFSPSRCELYRVVGVVDACEAEDADEAGNLSRLRLYNVQVRTTLGERTTATDTLHKVAVRSEELVWNASYWIQRTLLEFPEAVVVLKAQLPKTVAFRLGWTLGNARLHFVVTGEQDRKTAAVPWSRLVPLYFDAPSERLIPMWVRFDQVKPTRLLTALTARHGEGVGR